MIFIFKISVYFWRTSLQRRQIWSSLFSARCIYLYLFFPCPPSVKIVFRTQPWPREVCFIMAHFCLDVHVGRPKTIASFSLLFACHNQERVFRAWSSMKRPSRPFESWENHFHLPLPNKRWVFGYIWLDSDCDLPSKVWLVCKIF